MSDAERQGAVDRLKAAHDEGRLDLFEYDRCLLLAYPILRILWVDYAVVVVINVAVWLVLDVGNGRETEFFWPIWMVVPGVVLAGATAGVDAVRRNRPAR